MHESIVKGGANVIAAHLRHLIEHNEQGYLQQALDYLKEQGIANPLPPPSVRAPHRHGTHGGGCPGSKMVDFRDSGSSSDAAPAHLAASPASSLRQWPIQLHLVSPQAPYFQGSDLLLAADCAAFAVGDFHAKFMSGKSLAIACPKLDSEMEIYVDKLAAMIDLSHINTITVAIMEVPCCGGLMSIVAEALKKASRKVPVKKVVISLKGETLKEEWVLM